MFTQIVLAVVFLVLIGILFWKEKIFPFPFGMVITKSNKKVRLKAGDNFKVSLDGGTTWITLGRIFAGVLNDIDSDVNDTFANGETITIPSTEKCDLDMVFSQVEKAVIDQINALNGSSFLGYHDMGKNLNGDYMEIYMPELTCSKNIKLQMDSKAIMRLDVKFNVLPQSALVSCTPSTALPTDAHSHGTGTPVTGQSYFYLMVETAAS
jgi:hypothetical protein